MWGYELLNTEQCILGRTTRLVKEIVPDKYILYTSLGNRSTLNKMFFLKISSLVSFICHCFLCFANMYSIP